MSDKLKKNGNIRKQPEEGSHDFAMEEMWDHIDRIFQQKQDMVMELFEEQKETMEKSIKEKNKDLKKRITELEEEVTKLKEEVFVKKTLANTNKPKSHPEAKAADSGKRVNVNDYQFRTGKKYNGWVYFLNSDMGDQLWKARPDGREAVCLDTKAVSYINCIEEGYIYYTLERTGQYLKVKA